MRQIAAEQADNRLTQRMVSQAEEELARRAKPGCTRRRQPDLNLYLLA
jgi:hypothetical protein